MPTQTTTYSVGDQDRIQVDVLIGDGQPGGSTVTLGTTQLASGGGELSNVAVGVGKDIRGKKLIVVSVAQNENPATNNTSQQVVMHGSAGPKPITQTQVAGAKHEKVTFVAVVTFI